MLRTAAIISIGACFVLGGCEQQNNSSADDHYDRILREIKSTDTNTATVDKSFTNINVVLDVLSVDSTDYQALGVLWRYTDSKAATASRPNTYSTCGLKVGLCGDSFNAQLSLLKNRLKSSESSRMSILLANGAYDTITFGNEIAVPMFYYKQHLYSKIDYDFRTVGRSLRVTARKLTDGSIEMELTPVFSKLLASGGDVKLTELSTRIFAKPGQSIVIGHVDHGSQTVGTAFLSFSKNNELHKTLITVTPYLQ